MPVAGGGFDRACNAQAAVAAGRMLVVCGDVVQSANDKRRSRRGWTRAPPLGRQIGRAMRGSQPADWRLKAGVCMPAAVA